MSRPVLLQNLKTLFNPQTVAVIGASENPDKLGFHVMKSLTSGGFKGTIVPVNPGAKSIMRLSAFSSLEDYPGPIDLAIVICLRSLSRGFFRSVPARG